MKSVMKHHYKSNLEWTGNSGSGTVDYKSYERSYVVKIDGKPILDGSSDPAFRGDKSKNIRGLQRTFPTGPPGPRVDLAYRYLIP